MTPSDSGVKIMKVLKVYKVLSMIKLAAVLKLLLFGLKI